ncbi:MAG: hypothetical protein JWQ27_113 [Ferruginibacter sp.]|nr:hypothetical protein [Ferruginibacter sp.]
MIPFSRFANKCLLLICLNFFSYFSYAQKKTAFWEVGANPFSLAEPHTALSAFATYHINPRFELWTEGAYLFHNAWMLPDRWTNLSGFRLAIQPRYILKEFGDMFIAPEFRLKQFSINNIQTFVNYSSGDTLSDLHFREKQTLTGGALVFGKRVVLSKTCNLELTAGIGARMRWIQRKNIPAGYSIPTVKDAYGLAPHYEFEDGMPYFPIGIRISWELK